MILSDNCNNITLTITVSFTFSFIALVCLHSFIVVDNVSISSAG